MVTEQQVEDAIAEVKSGFLTALDEVAIDELTVAFRCGNLSAGSLLFLLSILQPERPELRRLVGDYWLTDLGVPRRIVRSEKGLLSPASDNHSLLVYSNAKVSDAGQKTGGNDDA